MPYSSLISQNMKKKILTWFLKLKYTIYIYILFSSKFEHLIVKKCKTVLIFLLLDKLDLNCQ